MKRFLALALLTGACSSAQSPKGEVIRTDKDMFGLVTCSGQSEHTNCFANRAIMGVSMGAHGAGALGLLRPELFDSIGMLGVPLVSWPYMLRNFKRSYLAGFCPMEQILAHPDQLNDPTSGTFCGPVKGAERTTPNGALLEPDQDFNHWYQGPGASIQGGFSRDTLRTTMRDLAAAFGNPSSYNPNSDYFPPGVTASEVARSDADRCAHPPVIQGFKNKEFNPDGQYDVIAFCDTATSTGKFDPAHPADAPIEILLAVDYNHNGIRDYAEPVIYTPSERYQDVGLDPNDRFDFDTNPTGKAGNWMYDEGEPFDDTGLDGVAGTADYGEGNGKFDYAPNIANTLTQSPSELLKLMPDEQLGRLNIYCDAGIRDYLASAAAINWLFGGLKGRVGGGLAKDYNEFKTLTPGESSYDFLQVDYTPEHLGQYAYVRYGDPNASPDKISQGDGNHIGTPQQVLDRLLTALSFTQSRFHDRDLRRIDANQDLGKLIAVSQYHSDILSGDRPFGVVLPPGYDDPENADRRYPVVFMMHGQGMSFQEFLASGVLFFGYMAGSSRSDTMRRAESDWAKMILIFPDSLCDHGECEMGNFNANFAGAREGQKPRYEDAVYELMAFIEANYRVQPPVEVPR